MRFIWILAVWLLLVAKELVAENANDDSLKSKRQASAIPTIENCKISRDECLRSCESLTNCTDHCPVCPVLTKVDPIVVDESLNELVNRKIIVEGANGTSSSYYLKHVPGANYTTIIKLSNIINNTNVVKVPTVVNSTNINNINIYANSSESGGPFGLGLNNKSEPCCFAIHPKTCRYLRSGLRCHHKRHKTCGIQCTSRQIHIHARALCEGGSCNRRVAYIPEPRPVCFYTNYWPYVNCPGARRQSCAGCYDHYGYGYSSYQTLYGEGDCNGCYDDGFEYGQMYRRGPVLRPFYYHEPPCYITGRCVYSGFYENEFGYYGHDRVDPILGFPQRNDIFEDEIDEDIDDSNNTVSDWGVGLNKCKVISANDTIKIDNCTVSKDNPYAAAPLEPVPYMPPSSPPFAGYRRRDLIVDYASGPLHKRKSQTKRTRRTRRKSGKGEKYLKNKIIAKK